MTTTLALLRTELTLLRRDTTAWTTAVALPFLLGALWALGEPPVGEGLGAVVVLQVVVLLVFTLHTVGAMVLAARREQLVLKRWRSSQLPAAGILTGSIGVPAALVVAQAAVLTAITSNLGGQGPASVVVLGIGVLSGVVTIGAATFLVAAFTKGPEHAMITTFPAVASLVIALFWTLGRPFEALDVPVLAIPGGATIQLLRLGWDGPSEPGGATAWLAAAAPSVAATVLITVVLAGVAVRCFRWEPRT